MIISILALALSLVMLVEAYFGWLEKKFKFSEIVYASSYVISGLLVFVLAYFSNHVFIKSQQPDSVRFLIVLIASGVSSYAGVYGLTFSKQLYGLLRKKKATPTPEIEKSDPSF